MLILKKIKSDENDSQKTGFLFSSTTTRISFSLSLEHQQYIFVFFFRARAYIRFGDVTEKSTVTVWNPSWKHRSLIIIKKSDKKLNN